jgi:hypothetical protein
MGKGMLPLRRERSVAVRTLAASFRPETAKLAMPEHEIRWQRRKGVPVGTGVQLSRGHCCGPTPSGAGDRVLDITRPELPTPS